MTEANVLEAPAAAASLEAAAPPAATPEPEYLKLPAPEHFTKLPEDHKTSQPYDFNIEGFGKVIDMDLSYIPREVRVRLLENATKSYILNRVSTAVSKAKKENAPFEAYEAAQAHDALQTVVPKPEGERSVVDYEGVITGAIKALYEGKIGQRSSEPKEKVTKDPLITIITRTVVTEVYEKARLADKAYKYPTAQKEVGTDGLAYLKAKIAEKVAAGADEATLLAYLDNKYVKPAKVMLGIDTPKSLKDAEGIL